MRSLVEAFRLAWILTRVETAMAIVHGAEAGAWAETDR